MVFTVLAEAGVRVGMYSSPHLVSYAERFRIGGSGIGTAVKPFSEIPEADFTRLLDRVQTAGERVFAEIGEYPTWFEVLTAVALLWFAEQKVDWAVLEVGMGGRLDATNVRDWPYKVITDIGMDHTRFLGKTIRQIAGEKAAIVHSPSQYKGKDCLVTSARRTAYQVIAARAAEAGIGLWRESGDGAIRVSNVRFTKRETIADIAIHGRLATYRFDQIAIPLLGRHQARNAALAIGSILQMRENGDIAIDDQQIRSGVSKAHWPGRCEVVDASVWPEKCGTLLLDGAHNPAGVRALIAFLQEWQTAVGTFGRIRLLFAAKQDKAIDKTLTSLESIADEVILCGIHPLVPAHSPESMVKKLKQKPAKPFSLPSEALDYLRNSAGPTDLTLVCGSLYLLGEIKKALHQPPLWQLDQMEYNADARRG